MPSLDSTGARDSRGVAAEQRLLERVRQGSLSAVDALFERYAPWLRQWARGRLPPWVRGAIDTSDLVQDTLHHTFVRLGGFKSKQASALRAYPPARRREPDPGPDAARHPSPRQHRAG